MLWLAVTVVSLLSPVFAENLASCANTLCTGTKVCRIIERCWGNDCQVGTTCIEPQHLPVGAGSVCQYDNPLLHSQDGGGLSEIQCGSASITTGCPTGTTCLEPPGVCCTGAMKNSGSCTTKPGHYYLSRGSCKTFCRHDQECPGFQRCCDTGVGCNACMDPVPFSTCETHTCMPDHHCVMTETDCMEYPCFASPTCLMDKTGECPYLEQQVSCADQCQVDSHCPGDKKCCGAGGCKVCVSPGMSGPVTQPPPPNFNGGFDGLGGTGGAGDPFGSTEPNTTSGITDPSFPDMSGFLGGGGGAGDTSGVGGVGDTGSSSSPLSPLDTSNVPSSSGTDGTTNPFSSMLGTLSNMQNGGSTGSGSTSMSSMLGTLSNMQNGGSTGSGSTSMSSMLDTLSKMQSGGSTGSGSTPMSSMLGALSKMQSGGSTSSGPMSMSSMLSAMSNMQNGGSTSSGPMSMSSMLSNVQNMMKQMNSGGGTSPSLGGTGSSSFNPMLANLNSINNDPPSASLSGLSSLSNLGPTGGGGGGLNPVLSGNTLQTLGSGGLAALGAGDGLSSAGLRPKLPSLGRPLIAMNQASRRRGRFNCGPWCMAMMMMGN